MKKKSKLPKKGQKYLIMGGQPQLSCIFETNTYKYDEDDDKKLV